MLSLDIQPNKSTKYYSLFHTHRINLHTVYSKAIMLCGTLCAQYYIHISVTITTINTKESNIDFTMNYVFSVHKKFFFFCESWIWILSIYYSLTKNVTLCCLYFNLSYIYYIYIHTLYNLSACLLRTMLVWFVLLVEDIIVTYSILLSHMFELVVFLIYFWFVCIVLFNSCCCSFQCICGF